METAKWIGAYRVVNIDNEDLGKIVMDETGGQGPDSVVECSGSGKAVSMSMKLVRKLGQYVQVGIIGQQITLDFDVILYKQFKVFGVLGHSLNTWELVMQIFQTRMIDLKPIISHTLPLSKWKEAFDLFEGKQAMKILLYYDE
jgi:L-iditol 2-dehydrogenase